MNDYYELLKQCASKGNRDYLKLQNLRNFNSNIKNSVKNCFVFVTDTLCSAFERLNQRSLNFGTFIENLVDILAENDSKYREAAAKEIYDQLGIKSVFTSKIPEDKWKSLGGDIQIKIKSSVIVKSFLFQ